MKLKNSTFHKFIRTLLGIYGDHMMKLEKAKEFTRKKKSYRLKGTN